MVLRLTWLAVLWVVSGVGRAWATPAFCSREVVQSGRLFVEPAPFVDEAVAWLRAPGGVAECVAPALWVLREADDDRGVEAVAVYVDRMLAPEPSTDALGGTQRVHLQWAVALLSGRLAARRERESAFDVEKTPEFGHLRRWVVAHGGLLLGEDARGPWYVDESSTARRRQQRIEERRATVAQASAAAIEALAGHDTLAALVERLRPTGERRPRRAAGHLALSTSRAPDGTVTLTIANRGPLPATFGRFGDSLPVEVEVQTPDGRFRALRQAREFVFECGTGPGPKERRVEPGASATFDAPLPKTGVPARVRLRLNGPPWSLWAVTGAIPVTEPFDALLDASEWAGRDFDVRGMANRRSAELRAIVRDEGMPEGLGPEARAAAGAEALRVLDERHEPRMESHFRAFLARPHPVAPVGHRREISGPVGMATRLLCGELPPGQVSSHVEAGRAILRDVIADPRAPNRAAIVRAGLGCAPLPAVIERFERTDDPDLVEFIELLEDGLKERYWPPGGQALARLAARRDVPAVVVERAGRVAAAWGKDIVRMRPALVPGVTGAAAHTSFRLEIDARTERPVSVCRFAPGRGCVELSLRDTDGREVWRSSAAKADSPRAGFAPVFLDGPLPDDLGEGRYVFAARPAISVSGLTVPTLRGVLEYEAGRWSMREPVWSERSRAYPLAPEP